MLDPNPPAATGRKLNLTLSLAPLRPDDNEEALASPVLATLRPLSSFRASTEPPSPSAEERHRTSGPVFDLQHAAAPVEVAAEVVTDVVASTEAIRSSIPPEISERTPPARPAVSSGGSGAMAVVSEDGLDRIVGEVRRDEVLVIPAGSSIAGEVEAPVVIVFGSLHGRATATSGPVVVMPGGVIAGSMASRSDVIIAGTVEVPPGQAVVASRVLLAEAARVRGEIRCKSIYTYEGARLEGRVVPVRERVS